MGRRPVAGPVRTIETREGVLEPDVFEWPEGAGPRTQRLRLAPSGLGLAPQVPSTAGFTARSWVLPPEVVFDSDRLADAIGRLAVGHTGVSLARLKGIFRTIEGVASVEVAGGRLHDRATGYRRDSRVDVIVEAEGSEALAALEQFDQWLKEAEATAAELEVDAERIELVRPDGTRVGFGRQDLADLPDGVPDVAALVPKRAGAAASLARVFERAGISEHHDVVVVAADGFATPPVAAGSLLAGLLVHTLDGEPLPPGKGGPYRLLVPGDAGPGGPCANVKGVVRIVARDAS